MKTPFPILPRTLCALALAAALPTFGRNLAMIANDAAPELRAAQPDEELRRAEQGLRSAERPFELAQATRAAADAFAEPPELPEAPEPPEPPEPPELPQFPELPDVDALINNAMVQVQDALGGLPGRGAAPPLIVGGGIDATKQGELQEDLTVMSRILTKALAKAGGAKPHKAMGILVQAWGQPSPTTLFIEDYGALFVQQVNYPLVAPPTKPEKQEPAEKSADTTWEETRAELLGIRPQNRHGDAPLRRGDAANQIDYDAGRVEALKSALLKAAKNTSNIRHLKPAEQVVIVVQGPAPLKRAEPRSGDSKARAQVLLADKAGSQSILTLRFKKSEADALAAGSLSLEEFSKKAAIATY